MSISSINGLSSSYLQSILNTSVQNTGVTSGTSSITQLPDNGQLSPFAQMMSRLQQLQQTDPAKYQQVTQQIATNLQSAAQTAQAQGNTTAANRLNQLSTDFSNASQSGQMPSFRNLAQAIAGHHHGHHHHHMQVASSDSDGDSTSSSSTSSSTTNSALSQFLAGLEPGGTQNNALNPMSIIENTLVSAGIS